jgi:hypothetical protein
MQQVIFESVNGVPKITVKGVKGKGCKSLTAAVEKALGETTSSKPTHEYTQTETKQNASNRL